MASSTKKWLWIGMGGAVFVALLALSLSTQVCVGAFLEHRAVLPSCPDGKTHFVVEVNAPALRRGQPSEVRVGAFLRYSAEGHEPGLTDPLRRFSASLSLVSGKDARPLAVEGEWRRERDHSQTAVVVLPAELPDGEHVLRAEVTTHSGATETLDVPLSIYAPAQIHVITDRPLYEPGNTMRFRAVALRARDLAPLDERPGKWVVTDAAGVTVLEENAPAGAFGVVAGELPLDEGAEHGRWSIAWLSGGARGEASVVVEPFTLPRFLVEVAPVRGFYLPSQRPLLRGRARYASGAPVDATVTLEWRLQGAWPPPPEWQADALPKEARTHQGGWFDVELPLVPADLQGKVSLAVTATAVDVTGDRAVGQGAVLLSEHAIDVEAVTELDGGLVEGFNNRLYLRATMASGEVLGGVRLVVQRAWDASDEGIAVDTDVDGVAALQIDPGPAVNVVIPPPPVRVRARPDAVQRSRARELVGGEDPTLAEQREMDRWNAALVPCARYVDDVESVEVSLRVEPAGAVSGAIGDGQAGRCVAAVLGGRRLPPGPARIFTLTYQLRYDGPSLGRESGGVRALPGPVDAALTEALRDARACLSREGERAALPRLAMWRVDGGVFSALFTRDERDHGRALAGAAATCVEGKLAHALRRRALAEGDDRDDGDDADPPRDSFGWLRFSTSPGKRYVEQRPRAQTMLGYELALSAFAGDERIGDTKLLLRPGNVPPLRLRATPVLPKAGDDVVIQLLRGPGYGGALPELLYVRHEQRTLEAKLDPTTLTAQVKLPAALSGWFEVAHEGARAQVYVRPSSELRVEVTPDRASYRPGEEARLDVVTTAGERGTRAAVGLFGVDETMAVLAPLPGPDEMAGLRPSVSMTRPAFGVLEATALAQGRIRGEHAAAATVLLVSSLPTQAELDVYVSASQRTPFDASAVLTDHFYAVLTVLHEQVRDWEKSAPEGENMTPRRMAELWRAALDAHAQRGGDGTDAFGRPLVLWRLPSDLLALTDPRVVVTVGTRLPEDVEAWEPWVRRMKR